MANGPVDPASLEGEALMRWYRRTPQEIEDERRQAAADAYNRFFYPTQSDPALNSDATATDNQASLAADGQGTTGQDNGQVDPWSGYGVASPAASRMDGPTPFATIYGTGLLGDWRRYAAPSGDPDSSADSAQGSTDQANRQTNAGSNDVGVSPPAPIIDGPTRWTAGSRRNNSSAPPADDTLWIATGSGGYRPIRSGNSNSGSGLQTPPSPPGGLPGNPAAPEDADLIDVGNPHNPRLRREWEKANNQSWPKTDDGRNYHVAHKRAIADGGTNTLDNIEPMHPDEHVAQHLNNGDSGRWGARASIARAFGGTVEPPSPGLTTRGIGWLQGLSAITGLLSGRIRHDTQEHMWYDMIGYPAPDDYDTARCRAFGIKNIKPGETCV